MILISGLSCIVLNCIAYCEILYCTVLCCTVRAVRYSNITSPYRIFSYRITLTYPLLYRMLPHQAHDIRYKGLEFDGWSERHWTMPFVGERYVRAIYALRIKYTILHCATLYCTTAHYITLHCTAWYCTVLHCTALHYTALHCTALHCTCHIVHVRAVSECSSWILLTT